MRHSIATVSLSGTLRQKIEAIALAGYEGFELFENDLTVSDMSPADVRRLAEDHGLEIVALQPFRDFEAMPEPWRSRNFDRARRKLDLMNELGTSRLLVCSNVSPHCIDDNRRAADDLAAFGELAKPHAISIGYEALAWGRHVSDYEKSWEIVNLARHDCVGIILDSFHILVKGGYLSLMEMLPADKIVLVQVADAPNYDMGHLWLSRHHRCFPGQGSLPVLKFCEAIRKTGYSGYFSHEIFSDTFRESQVLPIAQDGKSSLLWIDKVLAGNESGHTVSSAVEQATTVSGVEFIEFSSDREADDNLVQLLEDIGFVETHRHKSKDVSLYRLGDVNVVVNRQEDSYSYSHFLDHGVAVCAVGLSAADPEALLKWAVKFGCKQYESPKSSGEMNIPAVIGIGDVLFYFVDANRENGRFFDIDFRPTGNLARDIGVTQVDHVGQVIRFDSYLSASLFYRAVLDLNVDDTVEINDPYGVVTSRVAHNRAATVQIPLSTSRSWGASPNRFVESSSGGGIQQIAILSNDIFQTAAAVDDRMILPIPANYYADLAAKTALDDEFLQKLTQFNVLYDENEEGSFLHFYTREVHGVFFEFVQRIGGYGRFGESNGQVRLASQQRLRRGS